MVIVLGAICTAAGLALAVAACVHSVVALLLGLQHAVAAPWAETAARIALAVAAVVEAVVTLLAIGGLDYGVAAARPQPTA